MKKFSLLCEFCGFKHIIEDTPDECQLHGYKGSIVQGRLPRLDPKKGKSVQGKNVETMPGFRCPDCGRRITMRRYSIPEKKIDQDDDKKGTPIL